MRAASLRILFYVSLSLMLTLTHQAQADRLDMRHTDRELDNFAGSLMKHIAVKYFDMKKKPVIKVAIFEFVDKTGNVTVGSRYLTNNIRMAFARSPQFDLLDVHPIDEKVLPSARVFGKGGRLPDRAINDLRSDVYIAGQATMTDPDRVVCQVKVWGITGPTGAYDQLEPLSMDKSRLFWKMNLTKSGSRFFNRTLVDQSERLVSPDEDVVLGQVIFLTQPVNDDLNPWWQTRDGMILSRDRAETRLTSGGEYGRVMLSRKRTGRRSGLDYVIKNFTLMVGEKGKKPVQMESYIIPRESRYYIVTHKGGTGYRFKYLWYYPDRGARRVAGNVGKGWNFKLAEADWALPMPTGFHPCVASLVPISQSLFGTVEPRAEYVTKFEVAVRPGLNVYVINYVYHRDEPYIFVRRLELEEGSRLDQKGSTLTLKDTYRVYGSD
ncbi:MAG: hypothetical protein GY849_20690 [Deltaproteobacteria bacterium]|nr:hypothetical protein [Deltaproteobacteria bacterium]